MQKTVNLLSSLLLLVVMAFVVPSCKKDDEPPAKPKVSFASSTMAVNEADGIIEVEVVLDKAATQDFEIEYELSGTALDAVTAGTTKPADYEIVGTSGEIEIAKGETKGIIEIELLSDTYIENPETIEISISDVDEGLELTTDDETTITIAQEDGMIIDLSWPNPGASGEADMDLIVRIGPSTTSWTGVITGSVEELTQGPEQAFLPKAVSDAYFGVSYTYYDGTLDPLNFTVRFVDYVSGAVEAEAGWQTYQGTYTAVNKNKWTNINTTKVVQTFQKAGGSFTNFSTIAVPSAGSRIPTSNETSSTVKKGDKVFFDKNVVIK